MSLTELARPEIAALAAYASTGPADARIRLNANEAFCSPWADRDIAVLNRYPEMRPGSLQRAMSALYDVPEGNVSAVRGSSEAIDLLVRTFCRAYQDDILITVPTFEMYRVYAEIQGANVISVELKPDENFAIDVDRILEQCSTSTKLIFLGSPNNPTGQLVAADAVLELCSARSGKSLVIVDEAYIEFSGTASLAPDATRTENLVVLRTLSKAYALAGARCGAIIGSDELIVMLQKVMSPYSFATPVVDHVTRAIGSGQLDNASRLIEETREQLRRVTRVLEELDNVETVWPSDANFLLVRFRDIARLRKVLAREKILIREFPREPSLTDCARITIGSDEENTALLNALRLADVEE